MRKSTTKGQLIGPALADEVIRLLDEHNYTIELCQRDFGVGYTWFSTFRHKHHVASAERLQIIYEELTGKPLITPTVVRKPRYPAKKV
jgi:hypothetical protein